MRRQSWIVLAVAAVLGLVAVYLVNVYLTGAERQQQAKAVTTIRIAVARVPLEFGTRLTPQNVQFVDWPTGSVPEGAFRDMSELNPVGRTHVVLRSIMPGEPILRSKLSGEGGRATLSALLPPDMRAAAIRITDVAGVAGFALPGDRVDVLLTRSMGEDSSTEVLLHNIRIVAIDQLANENTEQPTLARTATLEVTQEDAQKLALGGTIGQLSLVLRSVQAPTDTIQYGNAIRGSDLEGGIYVPTQVAQASAPVQQPRAAPAPRAAPPRRTGIPVEVIRGTTSQDYDVRPYGGS